MATEPAFPTECPSIEALVQRVVNLAGHGYFYFCNGELGKGDNRSELDRKMVEKYCLLKHGCRALSKPRRSRRRKNGLANVDYFRFRYGFVLMATEGLVAMGVDDPDTFRDIRESPLRFGDYQVAVTNVGFSEGGALSAKVWTELTDVALQALRREFMARAGDRRAGWLESEFYSVQYNCYRGIRVQLRSILDEVNRYRRVRGLGTLSPGCIKFTRELPKHFSDERFSASDANVVPTQTLAAPKPAEARRQEPTCRARAWRGESLPQRA